jgi:hypothetical protein
MASLNPYTVIRWGVSWPGVNQPPVVDYIQSDRISVFAQDGVDPDDQVVGVYLLRTGAVAGPPAQAIAIQEIADGLIPFMPGHAQKSALTVPPVPNRILALVPPVPLPAPRPPI